MLIRCLLRRLQTYIASSMVVIMINNQGLSMAESVLSTFQQIILFYDILLLLFIGEFSIDGQCYIIFRKLGFEEIDKEHCIEEKF